ncbi:MAG: hypothetical protein HQL16_04025 [Candidatus Omnitrophica bacterium]|nr:hypothetical protein [Candidatus Omnitrophota bacterium]
MIKKIILLTVAVFMIFAGEARAQFFLEQGKVSLPVSGGDRINKSLIIHNTTADAVKVKAYLEDFKYESPYDGSKAFLPAGTGVGSLSQWFSFSPQEFTLPAFGKQVVDYTISVPSKVEGGHYGVLFFEKADPPIRDASGVSVVTRLGCLFFVEPKDRLKQASLLNIKADGNFIKGDFSNQSNVVLIPNTTYYAMDEGGMVADRGEIKKLYIPPLETASWALELPQKLNPGKYSLVINADLEDGDVVVKEIELTKDVSGSLTITAVKD